MEGKTSKEVAEWERVHKAQAFAVKPGKQVEFDVFARLCISSGNSRLSIDQMKSRAHEICEIATEAGYLSAN